MINQKQQNKVQLQAELQQRNNATTRKKSQQLELQQCELQQRNSDMEEAIKT
jgi:hypothetical protein